MKRKILLGLAMLVICTSLSFIHAQTWKTPVLEPSPIYDGSVYYIQNTKLNLSLAAGADWGTRAIVSSSALPVTIHIDKKTNLNVLEFSAGKTLFITNDGYTYTDNTYNNQWNIQLKDAEKLTYTIQTSSSYTSLYNKNKYLGVDVALGTNNIVSYNLDQATAADYIEWKFLNLTLFDARKALYSALKTSVGTEVDITSYENVYQNSTDPSEVSLAASNLSKAVLDYKVSIATPESPVDLTYLILNPTFAENKTDGWENPGTVNYHEVEFYQSTFNMYQQIKGLPAGKYTLKAQGFERPKANDSGAAYKAGTETIYARLYADATDFSERNTPFNSLYKHIYTGTGSSNGYANTMQAAEIMFVNKTKEYYEIVLPDILLNEGGMLTIGAKSEFQQNGYWALFDNFRLEYLGAYNLDDLVAAANNRITEAQELLNGKVQKPVAAELSAALAEMQQVLAVEPHVFDNIASSKKTLDLAITAAKISIQLYADLQTAIDEAQKVLGWYKDEPSKKDKLEAAISTAVDLSNNLDLTAEQINKAASDLKAVIKSVDKKIYIAGWSLGDVTNNDNAWSYTRSKETKNWILFWEKGYGDKQPTSVNIDWILQQADLAFDFYTDSLKFIKRASSKTNTYKMVIKLRYSTDWEATGSGVDNMIGLLTLTTWAANSRGGQTLLHEIGHCFQYQVHCDNNDWNGWMYGFGDNASGSNGFWEQCAQWQAYKLMPKEQFGNEWFSDYLKNVHKHILHESVRYNNYFVQDYWTYRRGMDVVGRLWNESRSPEDPVETYKRIMKVTQSQFNDEMYDCAARFATWDIPSLMSYGASYISARPQPAMTKTAEGAWLISPSVCIENYGHNIIKLNAPKSASKVSVYFEGKAGETGYRKVSVTQAGWRYGFVALLKDGTRVYSDMGSAAYRTPTGSVDFDCPANCSQLWLVVSGAPNSHWRHPWDDDVNNDEQWPYQVKFNNTNLYGNANMIVTDIPVQSEDHLQMYTSENTLYMNQLPLNANLRIISVTGETVLDMKTKEAMFSTTLSPGIYIINVNSESGNYNQKIVIK